MAEPDDYLRSAGSLRILHVTEGDVELRWDPATAAEVEQARTTVEQLLRLGYTILLINRAGRLRRVTRFDTRRGLYVVRAPRGDMAVPPTRSDAVALPPMVGG